MRLKFTKLRNLATLLPFPAGYWSRARVAKGLAGSRRRAGSGPLTWSGVIMVRHVPPKLTSRNSSTRYRTIRQGWAPRYLLHLNSSANLPTADSSLMRSRQQDVKAASQVVVNTPSARHFKHIIWRHEPAQAYTAVKWVKFISGSRSPSCLLRFPVTFGSLRFPPARLGSDPYDQTAALPPDWQAQIRWFSHQLTEGIYR